MVVLFPAPVQAQEGKELAFPHLKAQVLHRMDGAIAFVQMVNLNDRFHVPLLLQKIEWGIDFTLLQKSGKVKLFLISPE